jgi:chromosomal replication initiation ATPase DnaA
MPGAAALSPPRQLALALEHTESFAREDFLSGPPNETALRLIDQWPDWPAHTVVLTGPEGSGKSHLAAIWARQAGARIASARGLASEGVPGALATGALVVEDLRPGTFDERALFHLLNLAREDGAFVLMTTPSAPGGWRIETPDLASRLRAMPLVALQAPDDALLRAVLVKLFADRQIEADDALLAFLEARIERSFAGARSVVAALDQEALRLQRPVTRALAGTLFREP